MNDVIIEDIEKIIANYLNETYKKSGVEFFVDGLRLVAKKNDVEIASTIHSPLKGVSPEYKKYLSECYINPIIQAITASICEQCNIKCQGILYWFRDWKEPPKLVDNYYCYFCSDKCAQEFSNKKGISFEVTPTGDKK
jgi:hypothetical protein